MQRKVVASELKAIQPKPGQASWYDREQVVGSIQVLQLREAGKRWWQSAKLIPRQIEVEKGNEATGEVGQEFDQVVAQD